MKTKIVTSQDDSEHLLLFWCPGCQRAHPFTVKSTRRNPWTWNGTTLNGQIVPLPDFSRDW